MVLTCQVYVIYRLELRVIVCEDSAEDCLGPETSTLPMPLFQGIRSLWFQVFTPRFHVTVRLTLDLLTEKSHKTGP